MATLITTQNSKEVESVIRSRLTGVISNPDDFGKVKIRTTPSDFSGLDSKTPITTIVELDYSEVSLFPDWLLGASKFTVVATMDRE